MLYVFQNSNVSAILLAIVVLVGSIILLKYFQYIQHVKKVAIPGPPPIPFIGNVLELLGGKSLWILSLEWFNKYGNVLQILILKRRFIIIGPNEEELIKDVFAGGPYTKGKIGTQFEDTSGTTSIIFIDGESWSRVRRICNGAFLIHNLKMFVEPMNAGIQILLKKLSAKSSTLDKIRTVEMDEIFMLVTLDIIASTMFSVDLKSLEQGSSDLSRHVETYLRESHRQILNPILKLYPPSVMRRKKAAKFMVEFMDNIVDKRIKEKSNNPNLESKDLLDLLLDAHDPEKPGVRLTRQELTDQVMTFMVAGHETTAHTLTFAIGNLAQNPHVTKLLREEVDQFFESLPDGKVSYEDVQKLPYLTAVIKETMRMFPIAAGILRELEEDTPIKNQIVPKGSMIATNLLALHYNPKLWPSPTIFDPSRFLRNENDSNSDSKIFGSNMYAPFGHGKRSCIGQNFAMLEAKLILANVVHKFTFELRPMAPVIPIQALTFRPKDGLPVTIWERKKQK